jgi:HD-like signal output (HDOD) protein
MNDPHDAADHAPKPSLQALGEFVASVQHLPLFTGIAVQLIQSVEREDVGAEELSRLISTDAALSVQLLRMVNSSHYGLSRRIGTVANAIAVMGLNQIRRTVLAAVMQRPLTAYLHDSEGVRRFWRHQLLCASLARHLNVRKGGDGELAYMTGLLHDVGRLAMVMKFPQQADALLQRHSDGDHVVVAWERQQFGFDHALVGAALLEIWNMPAAMSDMLAFGLYDEVLKKIVDEVAALERSM